MGVAMQLVWSKQFWCRALSSTGYCSSPDIHCHRAGALGSASPVHLPAGMLGSSLQFRVLPFPFQGVSVVPYGFARPGFCSGCCSVQPISGRWGSLLVLRLILLLPVAALVCSLVSRWSFDVFDCFKDWGILLVLFFFFSLYCVFFRI